MWCVHGTDGLGNYLMELFHDRGDAEAYHSHLLDKTADYTVSVAEAVEDECPNCVAVRGLNLPKFRCPYCDDTGTVWLPRW